MKSIFALLSIFLISTSLSYSQDEPSVLNLNFNKNYEGFDISRNIFGGFIECEFDFVLGSLGMSSQEIHNRGFDLERYEQGVSSGWMRVFDTNQKLPIVKLNKDDMFNQNGVYSQEINNPYENNLVGLSQIVYISNAGGKFYIHAKSHDKINLRLKLVDKNDTSVIFYDELIGTPDSSWKKYLLDIPENLSVYTCKMILYFREKGKVLLDEASLIANDNINGIKKEYIELYRQWKPGPIRYPGGTFSDEYAAHPLYYAYQDIDQRHSPNLYSGRIQRFEIGPLEFVQFCKEVGCEPQFVTNMREGSPKESADLVEFLNGDTTTNWGRIRAEKGVVDPINVKYFEVGNEQWLNLTDMSTKFVAHAKEMLKVDKNINIIIGGNLWGYFDAFDTCVSIAGDYFNLYGWHFVHYVDEEAMNDINTYKALMAGTQGNLAFLNKFREWRNRKSRFDINIAVTELWSSFVSLDWFFGESLFTYQNGLWMADQMLQAYENGDIVKHSNRTSNSGMFVRGYNTKGERIIAATPSLHAMAMCSNHSGSHYHSTNIESSVYDIQHENPWWIEKNVAWVHAAVTSDKDSIYVAILNKHPDSGFKINLNPAFKTGSSIKHYEMSSDDFLTQNTPDNPDAVVPMEKEIIFDSLVSVKKLSFNIFAASLKDIYGMDSIQKTEELRIFPNPTRDFININNLPEENIEIVLYDISGCETLRLNTAGAKNISLDLRQFSSGNYILKFSGDIPAHNINLSK